MYQRYGKRAADIVLSALGLVVASPFFLMIAVLVRVGMGSPLLFHQQRPGRQGKPFTLLKFRTMLDSHDGSGRLLDDQRRLTRLGTLLRATSLDELPELLNVLRGEMSLVGPRPLLMEYLPRYTPLQARRHEVRPGITGWAQVNGRNAITWEQKFEFDVWYVDHLTFQGDLQILAKTVTAVLRRDGIAFSHHATMPEFKPEA